MIWIDQTLSEGLRIGMDKGSVSSVTQLLQGLQVGVIDVRVSDWQGYKLEPLSILQQKQIRGKVNGVAEEVELASKRGFRKIMISCALRTGKGFTHQVHAALTAAQKRNMNIALCIENASNFSIEELEGLWRDVSIAKVKTFIYSDGGSLLNPLSTSRILASLIERLPVILEFHSHNGYGLATANALGAIQVGVNRIAAAVSGVGPQGHAAIEEVIMAQKWLLGQKTGDTEGLAFICAQVMSAMGLLIPRTKAIIGQDIFSHESGIHVDGVIKNPQLYEAFPPEDVGLSRKLVIGKHSGTAAIQVKFRQWNVVLSAEQAQWLLKEVRKLATEHKKPVEDAALWQLYQSV